MSGLLLAAMLAFAAPAVSPTLKTDRALQTLTAPTIEAQLEQAAACLEDGPSILLAELTVDADVLRSLAAAVKADHPTRALREGVGRAVDPEDFVRLLDDACRQKDRTDLPDPLVVSPGRGRAAGVLVHPKEVFGDVTIRYGEGGGELPVDMPLDYRTLERPEDGAVIGPRWAARYLEPEADDDKLSALRAANPDFGRRIEHLVRQLRGQGAFVQIESAVRSRERGFLLYASFILGRAGSEVELANRIRKLDRLKAAWNLDIPIAWRHPGDWSQTADAARQLADTYGVVYATAGGARRSRHYDGNAVDLVAVALPRQLELEAPDGATAAFDLSDVEHTRELSLAPELIEWVEAHYGVRKLKRDYPHWSDHR
jgi:hypothetical protein